MLLEIQAHLQSFVCSWTVEKYRPCPRAVRNCRDIPLLALWSGGLLSCETIYEDYILKQMEFIEQTEIQGKQIPRPALTSLAGWSEVNQQYSHYMFYVWIWIDIFLFLLSCKINCSVSHLRSQEQIIAATEKNEKYITYKVIDVVWNAQIFCSVPGVEWKENCIYFLEGYL